MVVGIPKWKLLTLGWRVGGSGRVRILQVGGSGSIDRCGGDGVAMMMWKSALGLHDGLVERTLL